MSCFIQQEKNGKFTTWKENKYYGRMCIEEDKNTGGPLEYDTMHEARASLPTHARRKVECYS